MTYEELLKYEEDSKADKDQCCASQERAIMEESDCNSVDDIYVDASALSLLSVGELKQLFDNRYNTLCGLLNGYRTANRNYAKNPKAYGSTILNRPEPYSGHGVAETTDPTEIMTQLDLFSCVMMDKLLASLADEEELFDQNVAQITAAQVVTAGEKTAEVSSQARATKTCEGVPLMSDAKTVTTFKRTFPNL